MFWQDPVSNHPGGPSAAPNWEQCPCGVEVCEQCPRWRREQCPRWGRGCRGGGEIKNWEQCPCDEKRRNRGPRLAMGTTQLGRGAGPRHGAGSAAPRGVNNKNPQQSLLLVGAMLPNICLINIRCNVYIYIYI